MLSPGTKVKLKTFNKASHPPTDCDPSENYWLLIGMSGTIIEPVNNCSRVLVRFDNSIQSMGLHCHNEVENSLLIFESDLEVLIENDRRLVARLAIELYEGKITFDEFLMQTPDDDTDEEISELIDLITHKSKRGGFMGVRPEQHDKYLGEINNLIKKLAQG